MSETGLTLYDVESNLQAFADTEDGGTITDEQRAEFESELSIALSHAVEKRDAFAQFIRMSETLAESTGQEIKRLQARKKRLESQAERAKDFGARVILGLGTDGKGRYKKLEGRTATLAVRKNPDSISIPDDLEIPAEYRSVTIKMPATGWEKILESNIDFDAEFYGNVQCVGVTVDKRAIKAAIDAGEQIPGASVTHGSYRLEVR